MYKEKVKQIKTIKQLFEHVWETRDHKSEISGKDLLPKGHSLWHWQFAHVLSKQAYPAYKLEEKNIMLVLPHEHTEQEKYTEFIERREQLKTEYNKESQYSYGKF